MKTLTRKQLSSIISAGDPNKDVKAILKARAIALGKYLVEHNAVDQYFELNKFDVEYEFYTHISGSVGRKYELNENINRDLNFTRLDHDVATYCYTHLFDKVFHPIVNGYENSDKYEVYSFTLREKTVKLDSLQYNLEGWTYEYSLVRFTLNDTSNYLNVVMVSNKGNADLFKEVYKDSIQFVSKPHHQNYHSELLRVLGQKDVNTYRENSFTEPWLSNQKLDYKREFLYTKDWVRDFNTSYRTTLERMHFLIKDLPSTYDEDMFISHLWTMIPEYYIDTANVQTVN